MEAMKARKRIKRAARSGSDDSRAAAARWLRDARHRVRDAGNRIEPVYRGLSYITRNADGRGILYTSFNYYGQMTQTSI